MTLQLDTMVGVKMYLGDSIKATTEDEPADKAHKVRKTWKQRKESSRAAMAKSPMEVLLDATLDDATVDLADTSHRDKGVVGAGLGESQRMGWSDGDHGLLIG